MKKFSHFESTSRLFRKNQKGTTFLELIISMAVLGIFSVALIGSLMLALNVMIKTDFRDTARDFAEAQMENIQIQPYDESYPPTYSTLTPPPGFSANVTIDRIDKGFGITTDTGIQHIQIKVRKGESEIYLTGQKVNW